MINGLYHRVITRYKNAITFIVLISFLLTFILARLTIYLIDLELLPDIYLVLGETHVHHYNYGIFLLSIGGYLSLVFRSRKVLEKIAIMFGMGLGLTFDEFSLLFHLQDNYYARLSYEAIIVIGVLLINIIYFRDLWIKIFNFMIRRKSLKDRISNWVKSARVWD